MQVTAVVAKSFKHYLAGVLSAGWNGAIGAVAGIMGIDGTAITGLSSEVRILNWHEMAAGFAGAFVLHGVLWLKAHPLPEDYDSAAPFFPAATHPNAQPPSPPNQ
jgi:hypothetical protein